MMKTYILIEVINEGEILAQSSNKFVSHSSDDFLRGIKNKIGCASYYVETWQDSQRFYFESLNSFKKRFVQQFGIHI